MPQILQDSFNLIWLLWGLLMGGILETYLWQTSLLGWANHPIHTAWFGDNKRWRGLISLPLTHLLAVLSLQTFEQWSQLLPHQWITFTDVPTIAYGLGVGLACNLAELPNSFIKRRLNIAPGDDSNILFYLIDHCDSATGVLLTWWLWFHFPQHLILVGAILSPALFMLATVIRIQTGLKPQSSNKIGTNSQP